MNFAIAERPLKNAENALQMLQQPICGYHGGKITIAGALHRSQVGDGQGVTLYAFWTVNTYIYFHENPIIIFTQWR